MAALRPARRNALRPRLVWVEQTTNLGGGAIWPLEDLRTLRRIADERGMAVHVDGARLMNAVVASVVEARAYGALADSLWIDFSKGFGALFGVVLAGSGEFVDGARRYKHMLDGAMAGRDHGGRLPPCARPQRRAARGGPRPRAPSRGRARDDPGLPRRRPVETNIVICDVASTGRSAQEIADALARRDIRVGVSGPTTLRLITRLDVTREGVDRAADAVSRSLEAYK